DRPIGRVETALDAGKHDLRCAEATHFAQSKTLRQRDPCLRGLLDDQKRILGKPAAFPQCGKGRWSKSFAIRRIEEKEIIFLSLRRDPECARVAPENARGASKAERLDISVEDRAGLRRLLDEKRKICAARQRLKTHRAGARKKVDHTGAFDGISIGMDENIKNCLAQAVRSW